MTCSRCSRHTHLDFPTGLRKCDGCDQRPLLCSCEPVKAFVPEWRRRNQPKDLTGALAA